MYNQNNNNYGKNNNYGCRNHRKNNKNIKNTRKDNNVFADKNTEIKRFYVGSNLSDGIIEDSTINKDISGNMADSISLGRSVKYQDHRNNLNKAFKDHVESVNKVVETRKNMNVDQLQGVVAEADLAGSYNEDAAIQCKEYETQARLTKPGDPEADVIVQDGNSEIKNQLKSYKDARRNTEAVSEKRY